jgi:acetate kinase
MRELLEVESTHSKAHDAIETFCHQATKFIGAYAAALGGIDALVFTGGIGERSAEVRFRICENLGFLGIEVDPALNTKHAPIISMAHGRVAVRIIETKEEAMVARHVRQGLATRSLD